MAKENKKEKSEEISLEEARQFRASLYKPSLKPLTEAQKREAFRLYWAKEKYKYGKPKNLEEILWLHLKAVDLSEPSKFEDGLKNFGLKKIG